MFGKLHISKKELVEGSYKQYAYNDAVDYKIPFSLTANGGVTDFSTLEKKLASAVYNLGHRGPIAGSSYGNQTWSLKEVNWVENFVIATQSTGIGE